jgi:hypothetical protein
MICRMPSVPLAFRQCSERLNFSNSPRSLIFMEKYQSVEDALF